MNHKAFAIIIVSFVAMFFLLISIDEKYSDNSMKVIEYPHCETKKYKFNVKTGVQDCLTKGEVKEKYKTKNPTNL